MGWIIKSPPALHNTHTHPKPRYCKCRGLHGQRGVWLLVCKTQAKVEQHMPMAAWPRGSLVLNMRTPDIRRPPVSVSLPVGWDTQVTVYFPNLSWDTINSKENIKKGDAPSIASKLEAIPVPQSASDEFVEEELLTSPSRESSSSMPETASSPGIEESLQKLQLNSKKIKLGGAARKRLKWLLQHGYSREEALSMAKMPMFKENTTKQIQFEGTTQEEKSQRTTKNKEDGEADGKQKVSSSITSPPPRTPEQVANCVQVGLLAADFPQTLLTTEQLKVVQDSILEKILEPKEDGVKPKFLNASIKPGWLVLDCDGKATAEWLYRIVGELKPWEGADLKAVEENQIPRTMILVGYFQNCLEDSCEKILDYIRAQNNELRVSEWRVLRRATEGNTIQLTLSIDHFSVEKLKKQAFRISFKFGQVQLRPKGKLLQESEGTKTKDAPPKRQSQKPSEGSFGTSTEMAVSSGEVPVTQGSENMASKTTKMEATDVKPSTSKTSSLVHKTLWPAAEKKRSKNSGKRWKGGMAVPDH